MRMTHCPPYEEGLYDKALLKQDYEADREAGQRMALFIEERPIPDNQQC